MKKFIVLKAVLLILISSNLFAQSLSNWEHYYKSNNYFFNGGNFLYTTGSEEIIMLDKSTLNYTYFPYPSDFRNLNFHNNSYYDSASMSNYYCQPNLKLGPNNATLLYNSGGCTSSILKFDGIGFAPFISYQGFNADSIYFLEYKGGSNFFNYGSENKLYKYDGINIVTYDSTNSPIDYLTNYYINLPNDDVVLSSQSRVSILHNNTWTSFDTSFFGTPYINAYITHCSSFNDFAFFNHYSNKICLYKNNTATMQQLTLPAALNHSVNSFYIASTSFDDGGYLWITGDSIFCKYDGLQYTDYYSTAIATFGNANWLRVENILGNNRIVISNKSLGANVSQYAVLNTNTMQFSTFPSDPYAILPSNTFLPTLKDDLGNLFFGMTSWGSEGLIKYDTNGNWSRFNIDSLGIFGQILCLTKDTGNTILMGYGDLSSNGIVKIHDTTITLLNDTNNNYYHAIQDIAIDQNHNYWYGGSGSGVSQGLALYSSGVNNFYYNMNSSNEIYSVAVDNTNKKWVSYNSFNGVFTFDGTSWVQYNTINSLLPNDTVVKIIKDPYSNTMWFCTNNGFAKYENNTWSVLNLQNSIITCNEAENIYFDTDSSIWYATKCGFAKYKNNVWEYYSVYNSPLHNSDIESIVIGNDCRVWIATEFGLSTAVQDCTPIHGRKINGTVYQSNNQPAINSLVYVYKLSNNILTQVKNTFTDNNGNFVYYSKDSGQFYFLAVVNPTQYPTQISAYNDSAKIVQLASPIQLSGEGNYNVTIHLCEKLQLSGTCSYKGQLISYNNAERIGSVRVVLMQNNQAVSSILTNYNGSFEFNNLVNGIYSIWVDKFGFSNANAPAINFDCNDVNTHIFELLDTNLHAVPLGLNQSNENNQLIVFPNPTNDRITIIIPVANTEKTTLELFDITGNKIFSTIVKTNSQTQIDVSSIQNGVYFLKVGNETKKIIKN